MVQKTLKVEGMNCGGCENRIEKALEHTDGVIHPDADHTEGTVELTLNKSETTEAEVKEAIHSAGFEPA